MLTHKSTQRLVILLLAGLFVADFFLNITPWMYLSVGLLYLLLVAWGSYHLQTNFFVKAFHKGSTSEKIVALTFDDGPTPGITEEVLSILKENNTPATFFLIGNQISDNVSIVNQILADGHLVGNHSFSHSNRIGFFRSAKFKEEIVSTNEVLQSVTGKAVNWYRPPFGVSNPIIAKEVTELGMDVIGWNIRTYDTVRKDPEAILKAVKGGLCPGSVILLHDRFEYSGAALRLILGYLTQEGYTVVGLNKLIGRSAYR